MQSLDIQNKIMYCANCGQNIKEDDSFCTECGKTIEQGDSNSFISAAPAKAEVQGQFLHGKSWGVLLGPVWAILSNAYIYALIFFIPFVNIFAFIYFILKGREKIWHLGRWDDFGAYKERQEKIDRWAKIVWGIVIVIGLILIIVAIVSNKHQDISSTHLQ